MAKSPSELTAALAAQEALQTLFGKQLDELRSELKQLTAELHVAREGSVAVKAQAAHAIAQQAELRAELAQLRDQLAETRVQQANQMAELAAFRKQYDESDRRRFTLIGLIVGAVLSLAVQAVVTWYIRK